MDIATFEKQEQNRLTLKNLPQKLKKIPNFAIATLLLFFALFIELFIFNLNYFTFSEDACPKYEVNLPFQEHLGKHGAVLTPENSILAINNISLNAKTLYVEVWAPTSRLATGVVQIRDSESAYQYMPVTEFKVNTNGDNNSYLAKIDNHGLVNSVSVSFDAQSLAGGLLITKFIINEPPFLNFSLCRVLILFSVFLITFLVLRYKFYEQEVDFSKTRFKVIQVIVIALCLGFSTFIFIGTSPTNTNVLGFDIFGEGMVPLTTPAKTLLIPVPQTPEELQNSDAYAQLLSSFNDGHFNINLPVDPKLFSLNNMYDASERAINNVKVSWDRPFYDGKYYVYFGLAPLFTIYYPIYFLTGEIPSVALAIYLMSIAAILAMFFALNSLYKAYSLKANAVLFYLGELACVFSSLVFFLQISLTHYYLVCVSAITWMAVLVGLVYSLLYEKSQTKAKIKLFLAGGAIVLLVMSRPLNLLIALAFCLPPFVAYMKENLEQNKQRIYAFISICIPTTIGALFVMYYNYSRFDSIFSFGVEYMLNGFDQRATESQFIIEKIKNSLYFYLFEPLTYSKDFPFILLNSTSYFSFGNVIYQPPRFGIFAIPFLWISFIFPVVFSKDFKFLLKSNLYTIIKSSVLLTVRANLL